MKDDKASTRSTPDHWVREMNSCIKRNQPQISRYLEYVDWYRGNMTRVVDPDSVVGMTTGEVALDNLHTFVTDASIAAMFFRMPRFIVDPPWGGAYGIWTPELARVETWELNDTMEQIGYFRRARRRLLDARNGPYGVLKWTYDVDTVYDYEKMEETRAIAYAENAAFMKGDVKALSRAREDQLHSVFIEARETLLAQMQRGQIPSTKAMQKHVKNSIRFHEAMRGSETPTETVRRAQVVCRRVNPVDWFYDVTVDDMADCRWFSHTFLRRQVDVIADDSYDLKARKECSEAPDRYVYAGLTDRGVSRLSTGTFDASDAMVRCYEVTDLVSGTIREFFEGGTMMARERPYTMQSIQPSGPYSVLIFKPDPIEAAGIPPPVAWAAEQMAATNLQSATVNAAIETSRPKGVFNKSLISAAEVERIRMSPTGEWYGVDLPPDGDVGKMMGAAPEVKIDEQTVGVRLDLLSRVAQSSGLGAQRTLSGDNSGSATAAAITAGAADSIASDQAAIHEDVVTFDARMCLRLIRKCKPREQRVEDCGPVAEKALPPSRPESPNGYADRDIVNDKYCYVEEGSSQGPGSPVKAKLSMDFIIGIAPLPVFQGPAGQSLILNGLRRIAETQGITWLDWDAVDAEQKMAAMLMQQQAMMGGPPPGHGAEEQSEGPSGESGPSGERKANRPSEMEEPSMAGQVQGRANFGGGRVRTGASAGDNLRMMRNGIGAA